ncbi:MAG: tail fiber domain-containing protein [Planctomycetota bacterium]|jgi:type II secretory pathway pseudopilin PulG
MRRKRKAFTLVDLLFVIAIMALLTGILMPALANVRLNSVRMVCGENLSGLGRAMLIYANDYDNDFPRAGYANTIWSSPVNWSATTRQTAYFASLPTSHGQATITSSLYLLVKYAEVTPESFICEGEPTVTVFTASDYIADMEDEDAWDFGPYDGTTQFPTKHCSYSYHMPFNQRFLSTASSEPGMAVAADRNPWLDPSTDTTYYVWDSHAKTPPPEVIKQYQKGNAGAHQREGQNVLFMDTHVDFEKQSSCAIDDDNIYTYQPMVSSPPPIQRGADPQCGVYDITYPLVVRDSLLVNECVPGGPTGPTAPTATTGTTTGTTGPSDVRLKSDIRPLANVLDKVELIRGVSFEWNAVADSLGISDGRRQIGVLAQDVESRLSKS